MLKVAIWKYMGSYWSSMLTMYFEIDTFNIFTGENWKFWYRWKEETQDFYIKRSNAQLPTKIFFHDARGLAPFFIYNGHHDTFGVPLNYGKRASKNNF